MRKLLTLRSMLAERPDEELMLAYGQGDGSAFEELYSRHRGPLFRYLLRQLRDKALAEELYQDVWQRVIQARQRYRPEARFTTWLYQIAHNRLGDHWRAARHRPTASEEAIERASQEPDLQTPERELSVFEQRRRLQQALEGLPEDQREAVLLRLEQEYSLEQIAQITGVGRETVKSRLRYALDKLRQKLQP